MCRHASKNILFSSFPPSFSFCFPYHLLFLAMKMSIPLEMAVGQHLIPESDYKFLQSEKSFAHYYHGCLSFFLTIDFKGQAGVTPL